MILGVFSCSVMSQDYEFLHTNSETETETGERAQSVERRRVLKIARICMDLFSCDH
jgi:hypothetical protein